MGRLHGGHGMTDRSEELRDTLVTILLDTLKEHGTETPSSVLNVARAYIKDNPPEERIPMPGSNSAVLAEFLVDLPFDEDQAN